MSDKGIEKAEEDKAKGGEEKRKRFWTPAGIAAVLGAIAAIITATGAIIVPILESQKTSPTSVPVSTPTNGSVVSASTSTPTITSGAIAYQPVPLGTVANASLDFLSPPSGNIRLGGVPFQLSEMVFKTQASSSTDNSYPTRAPLSMEVPQAYRIHLLLNTGNGFNQFDGETIGQVLVYCDDTAVPVIDLQLGRNVREWHVAENVVSTASLARQVWSGTIADFPDLTGHIDMLRLDLPNTCRSGRLTALEVIDSSTTTVGSLDPALILTGITVEYYQ